MYHVGDIIDGHTLIEPIGKGGYGEVWRAEYLGQRIGIKIFSNPDKVSRGQVEAAYALGKLPPPEGAFFPRIEHINFAKEPYYIRFELCDGAPLDKFIAETKPDLGGRVALARAVLAALRVVHGRGFVHGDLSPRNIIVNECSNVRLIDFGYGGAEAREVDWSVSMFEPLGQASPLYAAPERFGGAFRDSGARADVYSFGKVLYKIFTGDDPHAIKPLSKKVHGLSEAWDEFAYKCVEDNPKLRFADAAEAAAAFEQLVARLEKYATACPVCGAGTQVSPDRLGRECFCNACGAKLVVEMLTEEDKSAIVSARDAEWSACPFCSGLVRKGNLQCGTCRRPLPGPAGAKGRPGRVVDMTAETLVTFVLYFAFWLPGAIANGIFLDRARRIHETTGIEPIGFHGLKAMFGLFVLLPAVVLLAVVAVAFVLTIASKPVAFGGLLAIAGVVTVLAYVISRAVREVPWL